MKFGFPEAQVAGIFALIVFVCDGLLQLKLALTSSHPEADAATRFFAMARRLPMELQMILSHLVIGSTKQNILHEESEAAFQTLVRILLLSQSYSN